MIRRLIYKLFGVYHTINIVNPKHEFIKQNIRLKYIPRAGELMYFDNDNYFLVMKVIHKISDTIEIFIVAQQFTEDGRKFIEKSS